MATNEELASQMLNSFIKGGYGQNDQCASPDEILYDQCGAGSKADCYGKTYYQYGKCRQYPGARLLNSNWTGSKWGQTAYCSGNSAVTGMCTSGKRADCRLDGKKYSHLLMCSEYDTDTLRIDRSKCQTHAQLDFESNITCPSG